MIPAYKGLHLLVLPFEDLNKRHFSASKRLLVHPHVGTVPNGPYPFIHWSPQLWNVILFTSYNFKMLSIFRSKWKIHLSYLAFKIFILWYFTFFLLLPWGISSKLILKCAHDWFGFLRQATGARFTSSKTAEKWWGLTRERDYCICLVRKKESYTEKNYHGETWKRIGCILFWMCWLYQVRILPKNFSVVCNLREAWKVKPATFYCP